MSTPNGVRPKLKKSKALLREWGPPEIYRMAHGLQREVKVFIYFLKCHNQSCSFRKKSGSVFKDMSCVGKYSEV